MANAALSMSLAFRGVLERHMMKAGGRAARNSVYNTSRVLLVWKFLPDAKSFRLHPRKADLIGRFGTCDYVMCGRRFSS